MKKVFITLTLLVLALVPAMGQDWHQGNDLKAALHDIIQPIKVLKYGGGSGKTWSGFMHTDCLSDAMVRDRYSYETFYFNADSSSVDGMNIEHIWANSWWGHVQNNAYKDLFNLYPAEATANMRKSNNPIGVVDGKIAFENGVVKVGKSSSYRPDSLITAWEPADEWKGDFARTYFYMATCYSHLTDLWTTTEGLLTVDPHSPLTMRRWVSDLMLTWADEDPVDDIERERCNQIELIQGNRNPFVDYPVLADHIWGTTTSEPFDLDLVRACYTPGIHITPDPEPGSSSVFSISPLMAIFTATPGSLSEPIRFTGYLDKLETYATLLNVEGPFEVSLDGRDWYESQTVIGKSPEFYVRFAGAELEGYYEGTVVCSTLGMDDRIIELSATVDASMDFMENFEVGSKGSYADNTVKASAATWRMTDALISGTENNKMDARSARLRASGEVVMTEDFTAGCDSLWFYAGLYNKDTGVKLTVSYSVDGGEKWIPVVTELPLSTWTRYGYKLDVKGPIRLRFQNVGSSTSKRSNIDNIQMSRYHESTVLKDVLSGEDIAPTFDLSGRSASQHAGIIVRKGKKTIQHR